MTSTQNDRIIQYCPTKPCEPWKYAKYTTASCWLAMLSKVHRYKINLDLSKKRVWITAQARHWSDLQAMLLWSHKIINNISGNKSDECIQSVSLHTSYKMWIVSMTVYTGSLVSSARPTFDRLPVITQHRKRSSSGGAKISTNEKTLMYQSTNSQKHSFVKYLNAKYLYCSAMIYSQFSIKSD